MSFGAVCLSRTDGARGEAVAQLVAERLGFRYVDDQIARAAELAQFAPALVAATEQRQPFLQRLIEKLVVAQEMIGPVALDTLFPVGVGIQGTTMGSKAPADDLRTLIRAAIHEVAERGQAVIVSHASSMALAFVAGVLRVLVTAPAVTRARRVAASAGMSEGEATPGAVARADRNRQDYFRRFYEIREEQSTRYDLVINTDVLSAEQAGDLIAAADSGPTLRVLTRRDDEP